MENTKPVAAEIGQPRLVRTLGPFAVWTSVQPPGGRVAGHRHPLPSLCVVLAGSYLDESFGAWIGPASSVLVPAGVGGDLHFGPSGGHFLVVEGPGDAWSGLLDFEFPEGDAQVLREDSGLAEVLSADLEASNPESVQDLLVELGSALTVGHRAGGPVPAYLEAALRMLREDLEGPWGLTRVAAEVGVHRVTLARAFRSHLGLSLGHYLRWLRLGRALRLLRRGDEPAAVAAACGFADQSHLSRQIKARFGRPPVRLRSALRPWIDATEVQDTPPEAVRASGA